MRAEEGVCTAEVAGCRACNLEHLTAAIVEMVFPFCGFTQSRRSADTSSREAKSFAT